MRRAKAKRTFTKGQRVSVQREVGKMWEPATYRRPISDMKGWHMVDLDNSWYIDPSTGYEVERTFVNRLGAGAVATRYKCVPTQRIKAL